MFSYFTQKHSHSASFKHYQRQRAHANCVVFRRHQRQQLRRLGAALLHRRGRRRRRRRLCIAQQRIDVALPATKRQMFTVGADDDVDVLARRHERSIARNVVAVALRSLFLKRAQQSFRTNASRMSGGFFFVFVTLAAVNCAHCLPIVGSTALN